MPVFSEAEKAYLTTSPDERRLGRIATVGVDGGVHVTPVGWTPDLETGVIEVRGINLAATKKFRDVARTGRAAIVIDDVIPPWQPRGVEVRGRAEAVEHPEPVIRIHPERVIGWGLDDDGIDSRNARDVPRFAVPPHDATAPEGRPPDDITPPDGPTLDAGA